MCRDVSLSVPRGAYVVVLGPIQSGKTMLLRHVVGLERAERGSITIDGRELDPARQSAEELRAVRTRVGVVFEGSALLSRHTTVENVQLPLLESGATREQARDAAHRLLVEVDLRERDDVLPEDLSRVEQRRVALARALVLNPALLVMDEPTVWLDPHAAAQLDDTVARLQEQRGFGALILSHEVRYAFGRAAEVYVMDTGRIVTQGTCEEIQQSGHPLVQRLVHRREQEVV